MIHSYDKIYLKDVQRLLGSSFDYAINNAKVPLELFIEYFSISDFSNQIEIGNPHYISGMSGIEFAREILLKMDPKIKLPKPVFNKNKTPLYWAGWALAYYQWYSSRTFKEIFENVNIKEILSMYKIFHECDITDFVNAMEEKINSKTFISYLKSIREEKELTQNELSMLSGVSLRSIQLYEQDVNDIDKAQAHTLYKLSKVLGCDIEYLLKNPLK